MTWSFVTPLVAGFLLGGSLIVAIGAQNAFILRQGLLRRHVFILCLVCSLSDALLVTVGIAGLGTLIAQSPRLIAMVTAAGALFLFGYAALAFRRAFNPNALHAAKTGETSLSAAMSACLAFTFLNPHVYLDTVVLVGSLSATYHGAARVAFAVGAVTASFAWFYALGYGARLLQPFFARPAAWRVLDTLIGLVMVAIGLGLLARLAGG